MENLIKQSRDFLVSSLRGKKTKFSRELFISLTVSKFLLLKENIIKKDSKNHKLYFDYQKDQKYIPIINLIGNYVKVNGEYLINQTEVVIENGYNNQELQENIWIFNKIRDSIAHGNYKIDIENNMVIINNDARKTSNFLLKCHIPLSLFEYFIYSLTDNKLTFDEYLKEINNRFDYDIKETDIMFIKTLTDKFNLETFDKDEIDIKKISECIEILENILEEKLSNNENSIVIGSNNYDLRYIEKLILELKKLRTKTKNGYEEVLKSSLKDFRKLFNLDSTNDLILPALYNYLQLVLSYKDLDRSKYNNIEFRDSFGYLKTANLMYSYSYYDNKKAFDEKRDSIVRKVIKFVNEFEKYLDNYELHPSYRFKKNIENLLRHFYLETIDDFADKNQYIMTSIRNSIEHANIHMTNGYVVLDDRLNQKEEKTIGFRMVAKPLDLSRMVYELEVGKKDHKYHLKEFLEELKPLLNSDTYYELIHLLKKYYKIMYNTNLDTSILMSDLTSKYNIFEEVKERLL